MFNLLEAILLSAILILEYVQKDQLAKFLLVRGHMSKGLFHLEDLIL
jgi:hypothetical protein